MAKVTRPGRPFIWGGIIAIVAGFVLVRIIAWTSDELLPPSEGFFILAPFIIIGVGLIAFGRIKNSRIRKQSSSEQSDKLDTSTNH